MSDEIAEVPKLTEAELALTPREYRAYRAQLSLGQLRLSPDTQAKFFALFIQGASVDDIVRLNKGFTLGQICQARVEGDWDLKRQEYIQELMISVKGIVQQSTLESIRFIVDQLAVANKKHGDAARKFLQDGDESRLKGFEIDSLKDYQRGIEILQALTGQGNQPQTLEVTHRVDQGPMPITIDRPLSPGEASAIIRLAAENKEKK